MTWNEDDQQAIGQALASARYALWKNRKVTGGEIVFEVIKNAADIERRMRVRGFPIAPNSSPLANMAHGVTQQDLAAWGYKTIEEMLYEIEKQRAAEIAAGEPADVVYGIRRDATPEEQKLMDTITRVFKECLVGRTEAIKVRDWKLIYMLGQGRSAQRVARALHLSKRRVLDRKGLQCEVIWTKVKFMMPKQTARRRVLVAA